MLRSYKINLKTVVNNKGKLVRGSRSTLVESKEFGVALDVGYKIKRSQGFPSLNLFSGSKTNYISRI